MKKPLLDQIKKLIEEDKIEAAMTLLLRHAPKEIAKDVERIQYIHQDSLRRNQLGLISQDDFFLRLNAVRYSLLQVVAFSQKEEYVLVSGSNLFVSPYQAQVLFDFYSVINPNHNFYYGTSYHRQYRETADTTVLKQVETEVLFIESFYKSLLLNGNDHIKVPIYWYENQRKFELPRDVSEIVLKTNNRFVHEKMLETVSRSEWENCEKIVDEFFKLYMEDAWHRDKDIWMLRCFLVEYLYCIKNRLNFCNFQGFPNLSLLKKKLPFDLLVVLSTVLSNFKQMKVSLFDQKYAVSRDQSEVFKEMIRDELSMEKQRLFTKITTHAVAENPKFTKGINRINQELMKKYKELVDLTTCEVLNSFSDKNSLDTLKRLVNSDFLESLQGHLVSMTKEESQLLYYDYSAYVQHLNQFIPHHIHKKYLVGVANDVVAAYNRDDY
ncbi:MAG: hypothetical protein AAFV95_03675 [Bacteroidota bacterium]